MAKIMAKIEEDPDLDLEGEWKPPPKIEDLYQKTDGNVFAAINRPTSGARFERLRAARS